MSELKELSIEENVLLAPLTTLGIGGPARYFARAECVQHVIEAFEYADEHSLEIFVLGGGSNVLVSDAGFDGLVLQIALQGITGQNASLNERAEVSGEGNRISVRIGVTAQAGEDWDRFAAYCVEQNLAGVECLSGIPGFVGGTPVQNVGAYGQEVAETIVSVRCLDRTTGKIVELSNSECGFSYRRSIFNSTERDRYVVLSVTYALEKNGGPKIAYKDLKEFFGCRLPTLLQTRNAVLKIRSAKSMVIDAGDPNSRSAGSFFKNPIVSKSIADKIENAPQFPFDADSVKISAAWLIENSGFYKGFSMGNVGISANHSLALVNLGGARAAEIIALTDKIQKVVSSKFNIKLDPEPIFIGF